MKKLLILVGVLSFTLMGCTTTHVQPNHEFVKVDITKQILPPPNCTPDELSEGYKEACIEVLQGYQVYLGKYLSKTYQETNTEYLAPKHCDQRSLIHKPTLGEKPHIDGDVSKLTDAELVDLIVKYTNDLDAYIVDVLQEYNTLIDEHNKKCLAE